MANIFLLEDDKILSKGISIALKKDSHTITAAYGFVDALTQYQKLKIDLFLLDINLPDGSGLELCRKIRETSDTPILFLTANDTEENITGILDMCIEAKVYGVLCFGMGLTLREGNREYFYQRLDKFFPQLKEKYIQTYGNQYVVESPNNERLMELFYKKCSENGIVHNNEQIFQYLHTFEEKSAAEQLSLWDFAGE